MIPPDNGFYLSFDLTEVEQREAISMYSGGELAAVNAELARVGLHISFIREIGGELMSGPSAVSVNRQPQHDHAW